MSKENKAEETQAEQVAQEDASEAKETATNAGEDNQFEPAGEPELSEDAPSEKVEADLEDELSSQLSPDKQHPEDEELTEVDLLNLKVADLEAQVEQLKEDLARARAETYNTSQEYSNYVRRAKAEIPNYKKEGQRTVLQLLLGVLDDVYAAEQAEELSGPFASIAQKLKHTLATNFQMESFGQPGEDFDPQLHEALLAKDSEEVTKPQIDQVLQPGYRWDEEVLRPCKVIVNNPL